MTTKREDIRQRITPTSNIITINSNNNNNLYHHNRLIKRTTKRTQSPSSIPKSQHLSLFPISDFEFNTEKIKIFEKQQEQMPIRNPLHWTKKWTKWFSSCGSQRVSHTDLNSNTIPVKVSQYIYYFCSTTSSLVDVQVFCFFQVIIDR